MLEDVIIVVVLAGIRLVRDVPYTGSRRIDVVGPILSVLGMGGIVLGILVWEEGGEAVGLLLGLGAVSLGGLAWWLVRRKRAGKAALLDPDLFKAKLFKFGVSGQVLQQIGLGGVMIALPIYLQIVLEYSAMGAGTVHCPAVAQHVRGGPGGREKRREASPGEPDDPGRFRPVHDRDDHCGADRAGGTSGWYLAVPLLIAGWSWACWSPSSTTSRWPRSMRNASARPPG